MGQPRGILTPEEQARIIELQDLLIKRFADPLLLLGDLVQCRHSAPPAEYWLIQIDSEHSGSSGFPSLRIPESPAIFSLLGCIVEVEVPFPLDRSVTG